MPHCQFFTLEDAREAEKHAGKDGRMKDKILKTLGDVIFDIRNVPISNTSMGYMLWSKCTLCPLRDTRIPNL